MAEVLDGQVPPRRPTREELVRTHAGHLKKQDLSPDAPRPVKRPVVAEAYPPCTKSIRDLEIIPLTFLRTNAHHRNQGLILRIISAPYLGAGVVSLVEDAHGNADKLAVYNQNESSILSAVPEGCLVAVKEPFYKNNGAADDYMICMDHPSDVVLLRFTDPVIPEPLRLGPVLKSAAEWRTAADKAFIERDFPTAVFCYTEALEAITEQEEANKPGLLAKRAGTNLVLGRYDAARSDALASLTGGPADWKALYTAGRAAYGLCDYRTALTHFTAALATPAGKANANVQKDHSRCLARLREEETGAYDFVALHATLGPQTVHLDAGSFLCNTEVRSSTHHGRGVFATRDLPAGSLVFAEKALVMPNQYEPARASAALYAVMVRTLYDNPETLAPLVMPLYAGSEFSDPSEVEMDGRLVDGVPVVDTYRLEGIRTRNCFSCPLSTLEDTRPDTPGGRMAKGLWRHASYLNHSCVPNSMRSFVGDVLISRATRDIKAGEEIFQQYVPVKAYRDARQQQYREGWGFECRCALCEGERTDAMSQERCKEILASIDKVCSKKPPTGGAIVPDAAIRTVDRLMRRLEELHDETVYGELPRLALVYPNNWLIEAHRGRKNHAKVVRYCLKVLRNFGFWSPAEDGDDVAGWNPRAMFSRSGEASLMTIHVVTALMHLGDAFKALRQVGMADKCFDAARAGYKIVNGFEEDLSGLNV